MKDRYYIKRQTRAGKNYGKYGVYRPDGVRVVGGMEKAQAAHVCAAFELARLHPIEGAAIGCEPNFDTSGEHLGGKFYVCHRIGRTMVGAKK